MLVDSHCHLDLLDYTKLGLSKEQVVAQAKQAGVGCMINVSVDLKSAPDVIKTAECFDGVYASVGVHPSDNMEQELAVDDLVTLASHPKVVAIGETGLDYYYNESGHDVMQARFRTQIDAANALHKPIIVHSRAAREDTIAIMQEEKADQCGGVMHCFTESWQMAKQALDLGFYISFSGIVTFKNAHEVAEVASKVPLDRILIETDAPYLTPVPYRGKPNQPAHVGFVATKIAELKNEPIERVHQMTTDNALRLFKINDFSV